MQFNRGFGPLVTVMLPSRGRVPAMMQSIDSLYSLAKDKSLLELIIKADDDDQATIQAANKVCQAVPQARLMVGPRGNGYHDMHHWVNSMSRDAQGDWLIIWNDDVRMLTQDWDQVLLKLHIDPARWHGVTDVCCLAIETVNHPGATGFFFLRRKVTEILGRFSYIPHNDTWATTLLGMVGSLVATNGIQIKHLSDEMDQVRRDGVEARETTKYTVHNFDGAMVKLMDAVKLQSYINEKRQSQPALSMPSMESIIPAELIQKYGPITDIDTEYFLSRFTGNHNDLITEVGAHDEPIADILDEWGAMVRGIDLREYNPRQDDRKTNLSPGEANYDFICADWCEDSMLLNDRRDCIICLSALEHFGLGTYGELSHPYYDVIAARKIWERLADGGIAYITVPVGGKHIEHTPHWRIYSRQSLRERIIQDFHVLEETYIIAGEHDLIINGKNRPPRTILMPAEVDSYLENIPHITAFLKLQKVPVKRIAPKGR